MYAFLITSLIPCVSVNHPAGEGDASLAAQYVDVVLSSLSSAAAALAKPGGGSQRYSSAGICKRYLSINIYIYTFVWSADARISPFAARSYRCHQLYWSSTYSLKQYPLACRSSEARCPIRVDGCRDGHSIRAPIARDLHTAQSSHANTAHENLSVYSPGTDTPLEGPWWECSPTLQQHDAADG